MERVTIIINDPPYGTERPWNALRYAGALLTKGVSVRIFLLGDAVGLAKKGQETPKGFYNLGDMLKELLSRGAMVKACGTCCNARGLAQEELVGGAEIGKMLDLAEWTKESDGVLSW